MSKSQRRFEKHRIRSIARSKIDLLLERQNCTCYLCESPLVRLRWFYPDYPIYLIDRLTELIHKGRFVIVIGHWIETRELIKARLATVDHLLPLDHPETNSLENLRASCFECNPSRAIES